MSLKDATDRSPQDARHEAFVAMSMEDYLSHPALSRSTLDRISKSPAHLQHYLRNGQEETPAMREGRVVHSLFELGHERALERYAIWTGGIRRGKAWDAFCEENAGKENLTEDELERASAMAASLRSRLPLQPDDLVERTLFWFDPETSIHCKARPDVITADSKWVFDLKTAADASKEAFERAAYSYGYHRQAAWYLDAVRAVTGEDEDRLYAIVVVEKEPPYAARVFTLSREAIAIGRLENFKNLKLYADCLAKDHWPDYPRAFERLELPRWAVRP